jgi:N-acetylglucosaminyldiphosphoundecaprenol N-acetyl-beta-D-mannosaminyltransferase
MSDGPRDPATIEPESRTRLPEQPLGVDAVRILGVPIAREPLDRLLLYADQCIRVRRRTLFTTTNAHSLVTAQEDLLFLDHFLTADAVLPDGVLPVWLSRVFPGPGISERISGGVFFERFATLASERGYSVFFLGASDRTLGLIRQRMASAYPRLRIAGTLSPPFRELTPEEDEAIADQVNSTRPDALFVGMTAPRQELFLSRNFRRLDVPFQMGIGAVFDYLSGEKTRPPDWLGRMGFEWLFRLTREPRRLARRNLNSLVFVWMAIRSELESGG